jgi:hypothetical protein
MKYSFDTTEDSMSVTIEMHQNDNWRPMEGDNYYIPNLGFISEPEYFACIWSDSFEDFARLLAKRVHKTKEGALEQHKVITKLLMFFNS